MGTRVQIIREGAVLKRGETGEKSDRARGEKSTMKKQVFHPGKYQQTNSVLVKESLLKGEETGGHRLTEKGRRFPHDL